MFSVIFQRHSRSNIESVELRLFYVDPGRAAGSAGHAAGGLALLAEQRHPPQLQLILQEIMRVVLNIKLVNILIIIVSAVKAVHSFFSASEEYDLNCLYV